MTRRVARPLLSAIFITSGINALRNPDYLVGATKAAGLKEPEKLVQVHGATNLAGGLALATGRFPRVAALGLAAGLVPTTYVGHPFWSAAPEEKQMQQINFLKNLGLIGGLLIAAVDTGGRESLPHALNRVGKSAAKDASKAQKRASKKAGKVQKRAGKVQKKAGKKVGKKGLQAQVQHKAQELLPS